MRNATYTAKYTPLGPLASFLQVWGFFGGFPLSPISNRNMFNVRQLYSGYSGTPSTASPRRSSVKSDNSWDDFYALRVSNLRLAWCYISNTLLWIVILAVFVSLSYGNDYSGLDYLFPLNVSSR